MSVKNMNAGDGETSYANNSGLQRVVISKTWPVLDETLKDMFADHNNDGFPKCMKIADLGCASGPNTSFLVSHIINNIDDHLSKHKHVPHQLLVVEVFLNDLPGNDFNNLFMNHLPSFCREKNSRRKLECYVYAAPGSFYGRLFPTNTLHFAFSSYTLHWLSQIPQGLEKKNKENIYIATTSPTQVFELYLKQFQRDFSRFLSFRALEIRAGGRMVFALLAREFADTSCKDEAAVCTLLAPTLSQMVAEGLVKEEDLHSFNLPLYIPCQEEIEATIRGEGSFDLAKTEIVRVPWDAVNEDYDNVVFDKYKSGRLVSDCVRAFMEPVLAAHFGSSINVDVVFDIYEKKMVEHLSLERPSYFTLVVSLTRK